MGYDLHITRSRDWAEVTGRIAFEEWRKIIEADPEFEVYEGSCEEGDFRLGYCDFDNCFYCDEPCGTINARPCLLEVNRKSVEVATKLGAVVQGDGGEFYRLAGSFYETTYERPTIQWGRPCRPSQ